MAMINIPTDHIKIRKSISKDKKPLMLKDYLRDDLSSCSSSGFKSFPRRQCCTTIRFLLEADLKNTKDYSSISKRLLKRNRSKPASITISALQRASEAVLNAVKLLPFASVQSSSPSLQSNSSRKGLLPRSFSRKLFKRKFWRKAEKGDGEIRRWRLFHEFLEEKNQPSDQNNVANVNATDTSSTIITTGRVSTSTSSNSNSNSNIWADSEFTADTLQSSSGNSESSSENDVVVGKTNLPEKKKVSNITGATVGEDSINYTKEHDWRNEEGKEQFSPVSVLDCPFDDEEDNSSPFKDKLARAEGTKQKPMQKIRRFESLVQLTPVDLEKRIALSELEDESLQSLKEPCLVKQDRDKEVNDRLLMLLKAKIPPGCLKFKADNVLSDFFRERMVEDNDAQKYAKKGLEEFGLGLVELAVDWVNGNPQELLLGWEVQEGRKFYMKEMERNENWRNFDVEKEKLGSEVELEVFSSLVDELLTDLF